jgi:hypothetical protein
MSFIHFLYLRLRIITTIHHYFSESAPSYNTMENHGITNKNDVVVVWGGTRDVGRNETTKGLQQIRHFVQSHKQTNVLVMSLQHRHDLEANSCVNEEVIAYNRKLKNN